MKRNILTFIFAVLLLQGFSNGTIEMISSRSERLGLPITKSTLGAANIIQVWDQDFGTIVTGGVTGYTLTSCNARAVLRFDNNIFKTMSEHGTSWRVQILYNMYVTNSSNVTTTIPSQVLEIYYDAAAGVSYVDEHVKVYPNALQARMEITDVKVCTTSSTCTPASTTTLPTLLRDVYVDLIQQSDDCFDTPIVPVVSFENSVTPSSSSPAGQVLPLAWDNIPGAESYDVEWLFVDKPSASGDVDFDFYNATRISTSHNFYEIPLAYPAGVVLFRVRAVGITSCGTSNEQYTYSNWSNFNTPVGNTSGLTTTGQYRYYYNGLNTNMNWSYTATYAEEGKHKHVISYFDGLLKSRQTVTEISSEDNVLVGETVYDHIGRPAVQIMPVPFASSGIKYYNNFNADFNADNFDTDALMGGSNALNSSTQAYDYYSAGSDYAAGNGYLPMGYGYTYTQARYKNDGTERISVQSGPGVAHNMGSGHETQIFYGTAVDRELDRWFGNEVYYPGKYQKVLTSDANGQVSFAYLDQLGRTVASGLTGAVPSNLLPVETLGTPPTVTADLFYGNPSTIDGEMANYSKTIVTVGGTYTFDYTLDPNTFDHDCWPLVDCIYDVSITVADQYGNNVTPTILTHSCDGSGTCTPTTTGGVIQYLGVKSCEVSFSVSLGLGSYTITKSVQLSAAAKNTYSSDFFATHITPETTYGCYPYPEIEPAPCPGDCQELCEMIYTNGQDTEGNPTYTNDLGELLSAEDRLALIAQCKTGCENPDDILSPCEAKLNVLKMDMSPGGQYFDNLPMTFSFAGPGGTTSSGANINDWLITKYGSTPPSGLISALSPAPACTTCTWDDLRAQWNDSWADVFVLGHPEYCLYKYDCGIITCDNSSTDMGASSDFDLAIMDPSGHMPSGKTLNDYLNPLNITPSTTLSSPIKDNSTYWGPSQSEHDPMFEGCTPVACGSQSIRNFMLDKLQHFLPLGTGSTPDHYFSLWYVANDPDNIHSMTTPPAGSDVTMATIAYFQMLHGNPATGDPGLISSTPGPNQITPEEFTAQQYLGLKQYTKYLMISNDAGCGYLTSDPSKPGENLTTAGFHIRFPADEAYASLDCATFNQAAYSVPDPLSPSDATVTLCEDNCSTNVSNWMAQVRAQCSGLTTTEEDNIENYLLQVCLASCQNGDTPTGSNDCGDCTTVTYTDGGGTHTFKTFDDVISFFTAGNAVPCDITICFPQQDKDDSPCWCRALSEELAANSLTPVNPLSPTTTELEDIRDYMNTTYTLTVNTSQVEAWLTECNGALCPSEMTLSANEFPQDLVDHAQESFAGGSCVCEQLNELFTFYGYTDITNMTQLTNFAASINTDYSLTGTDAISYTDIQNWLAECENACVSLDYLQSHHLPAVLECETSPAVDPVTACEIQNQAIADQQEAELYYNTIYTAQQGFVQGYTNGCIGNIISKEHFTMQYTNQENMVTLYYYDQAGSLIKTVPPQGVATLTVFTNVDLYRTDPVANVASYTVPAHTLVTNYRYDSYGNVTQQITPDGGTSKMYYDAKGRVVASQSARQAAFNGYSYSVYDNLGRVNESGERITSTALTQDIAQFDTPTTYAVWLASATSKNTITKTIYDAQPVSGLNNPYGTADRNLRNRVAAVTFDVDGNGTYENAQHYSYDIHGNVNDLYNEQTILAEILQSLKHTKYTYDLVSGNVNEVQYQPGEFDQLYFRYDYDADNRMTRAYSSTNGYIYRKEQKQFYYPHGALKRVEIGAQCVAGTDYAYTIEGWLKHLNASTLNVDRDMGADGNLQKTNANAAFVQDALAYTLGYFQDYTPSNFGSNLADYVPVNGTTAVGAAITTGTSFAANAKSLFNGNIAYTVTDLMTGINTSGAAVITVLPINVSAYRYDQANRLKRSLFYTNTSVSTNNAVGSIALTKRQQMNLSYDLNGNITKLGRYNDATAQMDSLAYTYTTGKNQLDHVDDDPSLSANSTVDIEDQASGNYTYDASGNLITDAAEHIYAIEWDARGKVRKIKKDKVQVAGQFLSDIEYIYNAMGQRIVKIVKPHHKPGTSIVLSPQWNWTYTFYSLDAQGNVLATYERTYIKNATNYTSNYTLIDQYIYGSSRLGAINQRLDTRSNNFTASVTVTGTNDDDEYLTSVSYSPAVSSSQYTVNPFSSGTYYEYSYKTGLRHYEQVNHLGNVMSTINDRRVPVDRYNFVSTAGTFTHKYSTVLGTYVKDASSPNFRISTGTDGKADGWMAVVETYSDYYPFGMEGDNRISAPGNYRYGYQGQEMDNEIKGTGNSYAYEYRFYDPRLGRFLSIDPLASKYPRWSPYAFAGNRVIDRLELEGLEPTGNKRDWHYGESYKYPSGVKINQVQGYWVAEQVVSTNYVIHHYWNPSANNGKGAWIRFDPWSGATAQEINQDKQLRYLIEETKDWDVLADVFGKGFTVLILGAVVLPTAIELVGIDVVVEEVREEAIEEVIGISPTDYKDVLDLGKKLWRKSDDLVKGGLKELQSTFDNLAEEQLLPKYRALDPNLKAGYTGSFKTGKVGNRNKPTFGQDINLDEFDVDYWIESDVLYKKYGDKLQADPEFRDILSKTPGFEGLKSGKGGFSIKFKPSNQ